MIIAKNIACANAYKEAATKKHAQNIKHSGTVKYLDSIPLFTVSIRKHAILNNIVSLESKVSKSNIGEMKKKILHLNRFLL